MAVGIVASSVLLFLTLLALDAYLFYLVRLPPLDAYPRGVAVVIRPEDIDDAVDILDQQAKQFDEALSAAVFR